MEDEPEAPPSFEEMIMNVLYGRKPTDTPSDNYKVTPEGREKT